MNHWLDATTKDEQREMMALALLDGWGEEWQEIVAMIHNANVTKPEHVKSPEDMRRFKHLEKAREPEPVDWEAAQRAFERAILRR